MKNNLAQLGLISAIVGLLMQVVMLVSSVNSSFAGWESTVEISILFFGLSIFAVVCGHIVFQRNKNQPGKERNYAIISLSIGYATLFFMPIFSVALWLAESRMGCIGPCFTH